MTGTKKIVLSVLGFLAAAFIISQLVMGLLLAAGRATLRTAHQHTGYTTVVLVLIYIGLSLAWMLAEPTRRRDG